MSTYRVVIHTFAEKHYCKDLAKKHKKRWPLTREAIIRLLQLPDKTIQETSILETIIHEGNTRIVKGYFKIFGEKTSALKSGHRFIARLDDNRQSAEVLLVYHKNHIKGTKETAWWQKTLKNKKILD